MFPWGDTQCAEHTPVYAVGDRVCGAIDGEPGTVISVDAERRTATVQWADLSVVYPDDTIMIRRAMPWE